MYFLDADNGNDEEIPDNQSDNDNMPSEKMFDLLFTCFCLKLHHFYDKWTYGE